jgi:hypothetical protein
MGPSGNFCKGSRDTIPAKEKQLRRDRTCSRTVSPVEANSPTCEMCRDEVGRSLQVLCNCEVQVELRFCRLRLGLIEPIQIKLTTT